jgi:hypothetical protein
MMVLQMIKRRPLTSFSFFNSLRCIFWANREPLPQPPSRHYSGHESGIISICARGPGNKKKGKVLIWFFSKLPIQVQSCTRPDPSLELISLQTQREEKRETEPVKVPAPKFKGPETQTTRPSGQVRISIHF